MEPIGPGTLKCVIAEEPVLAVLGQHVSPTNLRRAGGGSVVVHTPLDPAELRDILARDAGEGESFLVLEFEKWSGFGPEIDMEWLLARGH